MSVARSPVLIVALSILIGIGLQVGGVALSADLLIPGRAVLEAEFRGDDLTVVLPRSMMLVQSRGDRLGTTVQLAAGPFVHTRNNNLMVDSRLQIAAASERNAAVVILVPQDETHWAQGDRLAVVSAGVIGPGTTGIEIQVSFLAKEASTLASGVYSTRVVGTITGQ